MHAVRVQQFMRNLVSTSSKFVIPGISCEKISHKYQRCIKEVPCSQYHILHKRLQLRCLTQRENLVMLNQTSLMLSSDHQSDSFVINEGEKSTKLKTENFSDGVDKLDAVREELNKMREQGKQVPDFISDSDLEYYTTLTSKRGKKKFLSFLFKREGLRKREKVKKLEKQKERKSEKEDDPDDTLPLNRLMRRVSNVTILTADNWRLASAMKFGPQVAFDFSYDALMERPEVVSMVSQLNHVLNANKQAQNPFYMHWTGLKDEGKSLKEMKRMFGDTFDNLMVNVTDKDVLDIFPKDELIFLTSDSSNIMHTFDIDKIYVIGGLVDARTIQTGVTLAKAKRYNISHARFPLDLYLQWELGAKSLTLDQVARILHSMNETHDWMEALKNVPTRKHGGFKVTRNVSPQTYEMISSRPDLEKYYDKTKESIERKKGRKEGMIRDTGRFSFSRAKREFKWDFLESNDVEKFSENPKELKTSVWMDEEENNDFDPTGDTLFSSSEKVGGKVENSRNRGKRKQTKWYH